MVKLNLPAYDFKIRQINGKLSIFDVIRRKFVVMTPEEWVRQNFLAYMVAELGYPKALIKVEPGLTYNNLPKRCDIAAFDRDGHPRALVECKATSVKISKATFDQVAVYNTKFGAKYIMVTNGLQHFCCEIDHEKRCANFMGALPAFE